MIGVICFCEYYVCDSPVVHASLVKEMIDPNCFCARSHPVGPSDAFFWFEGFCLFNEGNPALFAAKWGGDGASWRSRRCGYRCWPEAAAQDGLRSEGWEHWARSSQGPSSLREKEETKYQNAPEI